MPCEVYDYVFGDINRDQLAKVVAVPNTVTSEVWWFYPSGSSKENDRYVIFNYSEGTWSIGSLGRTAGVDRGVFNYVFLAGSDGTLYQHETGATYDGTYPYAEGGPLELGNGDQIMHVLSLIPDEKTQGDCTVTLRDLPAGSVQCCVTSPPYYQLRDYGVAGQIGLEESPDAYAALLSEVQA